MPETTNAISDEVLPNGTEKGGVVGIHKPRVSNMQAAVQCVDGMHAASC